MVRAYFVYAFRLFSSMLVFSARASSAIPLVNNPTYLLDRSPREGLIFEVTLDLSKLHSDIVWGPGSLHFVDVRSWETHLPPSDRGRAPMRVRPRPHARANSICPAW